MATQLGIGRNTRWLYASGVTDPPEIPEGLLLTGTPNSGWLKSDIQGWLDDHDIAYDSEDTKAELLAIVEDQG